MDRPIIKNIRLVEPYRIILEGEGIFISLECSITVWRELKQIEIYLKE
jgi:hypothetical protein